MLKLVGEKRNWLLDVGCGRSLDVAPVKDEDELKIQGDDTNLLYCSELNLFSSTETGKTCFNWLDLMETGINLLSFLEITYLRKCPGLSSSSYYLTSKRLRSLGDFLSE